jgi:hypothetical protein
MSKDGLQEPSRPGPGSKNELERREALIKLGKYTAYAAPILIATVTSAQALTLSGAPSPSPGPAPSPGPSPSPGPVSDIRLKRDIQQLGRSADGIGIYRYKYLWSDTSYVGVMAQEVAAIEPEAISSGPDGYLRVDYTRLGLSLQTWDQWRRRPNSRRSAAAA